MARLLGYRVQINLQSEEMNIPKDKKIVDEVHRIAAEEGNSKIYQPRILQWYWAEADVP